MLTVGTLCFIIKYGKVLLINICGLKAAVFLHEWK